MKDQVLVQIRVDRKLKEEAAELLDSIGLDIPTAVRMFLKSVVREKGLPLDVSTNTAEATPKAEKKVDYSELGVFAPYHLPDVADNEVLLLPRDHAGRVSTYMYVQLICKIPEGRVSRFLEIEDFLKKAYGLDHVARGDEYLPAILDTGKQVPYWRVISQRGIVQEWYIGAGEGRQQELLVKEGLSVSPSGPNKSSPKVNHYKELIYDFSDIKVVKG